MIKRRIGGQPEAQANLEAAIARYAETNDPADHAEALRLYEIVSGFKAGCGVCIAGRKNFVQGLSAIVQGDLTTGANKMRNAMRSVRLKLDILGLAK